MEAAFLASLFAYKSFREATSDALTDYFHHWCVDIKHFDLPCDHLCKLLTYLSITVSFFLLFLLISLEFNIGIGLAHMIMYMCLHIHIYLYPRILTAEMTPQNKTGFIVLLDAPDDFLPTKKEPGPQIS